MTVTGLEGGNQMNFSNVQGFSFCDFRRFFWLHLLQVVDSFLLFVEFSSNVRQNYFVEYRGRTLSLQDLRRIIVIITSRE